MSYPIEVRGLIFKNVDNPTQKQVKFLEDQFREWLNAKGYNYQGEFMLIESSGQGVWIG